MNGLNRAELLGRLAFDPDLRYTGQGTAYCRLRVATSRMVNGETKTDFHDVIAWHTLAETCAKAVKKGEVVHVEGRLETSSWEQEAQRMQRTRVVAMRIVFLGAGHRRAETEAAAETEGAGEEPA